MASALTKRVIAFAALAFGSLTHGKSAQAEPSTLNQSQPFELWSGAMSGLSSVELSCQPAPPAWRLRETIDPWASTRPACDQSTERELRARELFVSIAEIIDPWPGRADTVASSTAREIIDPWTPSPR